MLKNIILFPLVVIMAVSEYLDFWRLASWFEKVIEWLTETD